MAKNIFCVRIRSRIQIGTEAYYRDGIRLEYETYAIAQHLFWNEYGNGMERAMARIGIES